VLRPEGGAGVSAPGAALRCLEPHRLSDAELPMLARALVEARLPADDLARPGRRLFRFAERPGETAGYGGFELCRTAALLRSIIVLPAWRGRGVGERIVQGLAAAAGEAGATDAFVLTTTAQGYFERLGFRQVERSAAPEAILGTAQATSLCPASAKLLFKAVVP